MFPNAELAEELAGRCSLLVGVDPDETARENPYLHEWLALPLEQYQTKQQFDLVTLRMVAEHVTQPAELIAKLSQLVAPEGRVIVYTVHRWSPVALAASLVPHRLHHPLKWLMWRTQERDTFPVAYRLNTRSALAQAFARGGFQEEAFWVLPDCKIFFRYWQLHLLELRLWRICRVLKLAYPENCLLGVYRREGTVPGGNSR
jgi:SAM-dependent methyltransferase